MNKVVTKMAIQLLDRKEINLLKQNHADVKSNPEIPLKPLFKLHAEGCMWLITHAYEDDDTLGGLEYIEGGFPELKTFSLSELEIAASAPFSLIVERDKEFVSQGKTIADFAVELQPIAAIA
jgi:hypothetical protein